MKKFVFNAILAFLVLGGAAAFYFVSDATKFSTQKLYLYLPEQAADKKQEIFTQLRQQPSIKALGLVDYVGSSLGIWQKLKPGRYAITRGMNLVSILRMFRNGRQEPVKLVVNKMRTRTDIANFLAKNFAWSPQETEAFLASNDSLAPFLVDSNSVATLFIPNTYELYWSKSIPKILSKLADEKDQFWKSNDRLQKAANQGITPTQAYTIASIVEEETNYNPEKGKVASVYINRWRKGMALGADPTVKFALNDFSIKRILFEHLKIASPYNTYKVKGLPPGPICVPSISSIDAVLNAPTTNYLFFVASPNFDGTHVFTETYEQHLQYAKQYQEKLNNANIQ
jgi:UPF0755 protein